MGRSGKNKKKEAWPEEDEPDADDEEISEDEAFDSDDEKKYGSFFEERKKKSISRATKDGEDSNEEEDSEESQESDDSEDDDSDDSDSESKSKNSDDDDEDDDDEDDDDEVDGNDYVLSLLDKLDEKKDGSAKEKNSNVASFVKESEFSSSVVPKASLTLDSLMTGLEDTQGFGVVQKTMKKVAAGSATAAPLSRVVSSRAQRKVHYTDQVKEVALWMDTVRENRLAETLDFRPKNRAELTRDMLVDKFVPTTDFEKQIHAALQEAGQKDEEAILKAEEKALQDDLGANEITMEEYKKRRGELAKMRALMFYHEQKMARMKKIKSKKYRRIRKKQREREKTTELTAQAEEDPDILKELQEKEEMERMKERMTLAHKNTSKWAKRILKRGKNVDVDTRRALSAQLKRGDDLLLRMQSTQAGEKDDDSDEEDLIESAKKVIADTDNDDGEATKGKGLMGMAFMQRGIQKQREEAKEEARKLLQELRESEDLERDDDDLDGLLPKSKKGRIASKGELKEVLDEGEMIASSLQFGNSNSLAVTGGISIDLDGDKTDRKSTSPTKDANASDSEEEESNDALVQNKKLSEHNAEFKTSKAVSTKAGTAANSSRKESKSANSEKGALSISAPQETKESEENPWLEAKGRVTDAKERKAVAAKRRGMVDVEKAVNLLSSEPANVSSGRNKVQAESKENTDEPSKDKSIKNLTQEELVRRAFAAPSEKDVDDEFAKEKTEVETFDDPTRKQKKVKDMNEISGWGSWTGKGALPGKPPRNFPNKLQPPEKKIPKRKREDENKPDVIIREKRLKNMADKYMIPQVPYPYASREDYERSMIGGIGREWNVTKGFRDMTRSEIITRPGKIIQPLSVKAKKRRDRPGAKF